MTSTTDTETAERLERVEAELARVRQRADARDHLGPIDVPASASAMWNHERALERRAAQLKAAERERKQAEMQARIDAPAREKRDRELAKLDAKIAENVEERTRLSAESSALMAERTAVAGSMAVVTPLPPRPPIDARAKARSDIAMGRERAVTGP